MKINCFAVLFAGMLVMPVHGTIITTIDYVAKDSYLSTTSPGFPAGMLPFVKSFEDVEQPLLQYDMTSIPIGGEVLEVTITFTLAESANFREGSLTLAKFSQPWEELTATADNFGLLFAQVLPDITVTFGENEQGEQLVMFTGTSQLYEALIEGSITVRNSDPDNAWVSRSKESPNGGSYVTVISSVPEPGTGLFGAGLFVFALLCRRRT